MIAINTSFRRAPFADVLYGGDGRWWNVYGAEARRVAAGELWTADALAAQQYGLRAVHNADDPGLCLAPGKIHTGKNSGYAAMGLAFMWGAATIVLLGYDFQRTGGRSHWHGDHEGSLPNLSANLEGWVRRMVQLGADLRAHGVRVVNASRETAITCFPRAPIEDALA